MNLIINHTSMEPIYEQIVAQIKADVWIILIPLASAMPFIMDGIMVGATETKVMRNSMLLSTVAYFGIFYSLYPVIGNNALWLAFTLYMFLRGTLQLLMTRRLRLIYRKAAA